MNKFLLIFIRFCAFFLVPFLEIAILRFFIPKDIIYQNLILLFSPGKIFLAVIPVAIALLVFLLLLDKREEILTVSLQRYAFAANLVFFVLFLLISLNLDSLKYELSREGLSFLWYLLGFVTFSTSFFVFVDIREFFEKVFDFKYEFLFSLFTGGIFLFSQLGTQYLWIYFSKPVTLIAYFFLRLFGYNITYGSDGYTLIHPSLTTIIGEPCSGLEGITLFLFLFSLVLILDWKQYTFRKALLIYALGIAFMLVLNIVRVTLIFMAALWAVEKWGPTKGSELFVWFFHANVGWVFYLIGICIFFVLLFKLNKTVNKPTKPSAS